MSKWIFIKAKKEDDGRILKKTKKEKKGQRKSVKNLEILSWDKRRIKPSTFCLSVWDPDESPV